MDKVYPNKLFWRLGFSVLYPAGNETLKYGSHQNVTVQLGESKIYVIVEVDIYDDDHNYRDTLFGGEVPVGSKTEVTVPFILAGGTLSSGEYHYTVWGFNTPTSPCQTSSNSFMVSK